MFSSLVENKFIEATTTGFGTKDSPPDQPLSATAIYSGACAYDPRHTRLFFTPLGINQLRYVDLADSKSEAAYVSGSFGTAKGLQDVASHITRMVISADGNGYALSNDATHFLKFPTEKESIITDLGSLTDDPANRNVSIHAFQHGWGGDMVADKANNLYVVTNGRAIFKIDPKRRVAAFLGHIKRLPENFIISGAAVDEFGQLIVGSTDSSAGYYAIDTKTYGASKYSNSNYGVSDMATGNLLAANEQHTDKRPVSEEVTSNKTITVHPNPIVDNLVKIKFTNYEKGSYTVRLIGLASDTVWQQAITLDGERDVQALKVNRNLPQGLYLLVIVSPTNEVVNSSKILF